VRLESSVVKVKVQIGTVCRVDSNRTRGCLARVCPAGVRRGWGWGAASGRGWCTREGGSSDACGTRSVRWGRDGAQSSQ